MMSLFSSFDLFFFNYYPFSFIFLFFIVYCNFWMQSMFVFFFNMSYSYMSSFFFSIFSFKFKSFDSFFFSLMTFIFLININSIFPFFFSLTSQISFSFFWGFSIWLSLFIYSVKNSLKFLLIHFVPLGAPLFLIWFLFLVELVSMIIRPLTLVVRLVANILAGHLLMILLSKMVFMLYPFFFLYFFLNMVEMFVSLIQSYIFVTMLCLYFSEMS